MAGEASEMMTKANFLRPDQRGARVWGDHDYSRQQVNAGNGASAWTKAEEEGLADSNHGAAAGWGRVHGARTAESGPKGKMPDREVIAEGGHRQSLGPLWRGDE